jgi:hypothetical protein
MHELRELPPGLSVDFLERPEDLLGLDKELLVDFGYLHHLFGFPLEVEKDMIGHSEAAK